MPTSYAWLSPMLAEDTPRILVVDDEPVIREILADFLSMEDFAVETAADGAAAIEALEQHPYDLVLSDLKMPKVGGIELLQRLRELQPTAKAVIMTGFGTVETAIDAMKSGAHDYILKPFRVDEVVLTVRRALDEQRLEAENLRLREAVGLYEVSEAMASTLNLQELLDTVTTAASEATGADSAVLMLRDPDKGMQLRGPSHEAPAFDAEALYEQVKDTGVSLRLRGEATAPYVTGGKAPGALLAVPMKESGELLGVLALSREAEGSRFDEGQRKLTSMLGHRAAAAIVNARLFANLQDTIQETIEGLARAIDKLDPYTAGHSDRVALYSGLLAEKLELSEADIAVIRQSAQMHDIGKIGCHVNLNKPGKLTADEYEEFKKHPTFGKEILEPITSLAALIPGVHLHHERMDGRGYPLGIPGDELPLMARIICIADSYDAMTSDRAYRAALKHDVAVAELRRCSGTQFDAELVELFVEAMNEWRDAELAAGNKIPH